MNQILVDKSKDIRLESVGLKAGESAHRLFADELAEMTGLSRLVLVQSDQKNGDSLLAIRRTLVPLSVSIRWWLRGDSNVTIHPTLALLKVKVGGETATNVVSRLKQQARQRLKYCLILAVLFAVLVDVRALAKPNFLPAV